MDLNELIGEIKKLSVEDLTLVSSEIEGAIKKKALAALDAKEEELNELRVLAGMKRKPTRKKKA